MVYKPKSMTENQKEDRISKMHKIRGLRYSGDGNGALRILGSAEFALDVLREEGFRVYPVNKN